jgi:NADH:ubiquinone oxidoreductase subunit 5 (subunit L)/multisubunit Na+/H+ antiporter MnhA subunit
MDESLHPEATGHLPSFITAPGETDVLMVVMSVVLALAVLMFGILFLRLHTLPERIAHKSQKLQFELVAVLGLIALFTHMHIFWIAGLLLALVEFPDFGTPLARIAGSVEKLADGGADAASTAVVPEAVTSLARGDEKSDQQAVIRPYGHHSPKDGNSATGVARTDVAPAAREELSHHG